ncbi:hypothetical protein LTR72_012034 [Exophiala xenobiotica]|nr:hypothetical protein LTR72_012034 [Exophiala xenobiotica]KAK5282924.1 hypothetical protein LTR14_011956 [Exophiala xenobiotica]KAK5458931.1 hypothetical protein LTR55_011969 [Exophiala xenobiotica]
MFSLLSQTRCLPQTIGPLLKRSTRRLINTSQQTFSSRTLANLIVTENTRVLYQGITGKAVSPIAEIKGTPNASKATGNARASILNGTKVVGGVSPGKGGTTHLDLPVFNTVAEAANQVKPDASLIYVPASGAANAIVEAIAAEIPLLVSLAEHVPVHDMLKVHQVLRTQTASRLLGPNCPGVIAPGKCRIGIIPHEQTSPGHVGIISRSGTMIYEALGATEHAGLGQSLVIGLGGDMMPGTTMTEALQLMISHQPTKMIILIGEIGGSSELDAAVLIRLYRSSTPNPKPIIAIISGRNSAARQSHGARWSLALIWRAGCRGKSSSSPSGRCYSCASSRCAGCGA